MKRLVTQTNAASSFEDALQQRFRMTTAIAEFSVHNEQDVKAAAQRARLLGTLVDLPDRQRTDFGKAIREICRNAVQHAGGGQVEFRIERTEQGAMIECLVSDTGGGCPEIESILALSSGPDCGLRRAAAGTDRIFVESNENGKRIRAVVAISPSAANVNETDIAEWASILRTRRTQSALASTQRRTRELAEQLSTMQRQRQELQADLQRSQSLNETLTLLSLVASKTDNAVIIMDGNGLATWANDAFIRMTGYSMHDTVGARPDRLLSGPKTNRESLQELEQAFKLGHGVSEEFLQYRREGTTGWISLSLTPIHDKDGTVTRWIGIGSDTTRRKEAQRALEAARDAAEKASQLKGEFLANISHEIRTPMNAIIGMTDLTLCTNLDEDQREYLTTVKQSAEALLELLNDILDLSKIESGRLEIDETPIDIRSVVSETLRPLAFIAKRKGLRLTAGIPSDVPACIVGDALRLRQILVNLVGNAIKFTAEGSVEVTMEKQWEADGEVGLQFTVSDTGTGIPADKLERIFDAFSQADSSITRQYGGTGLGLAITSQLLKLMKGRIWVQSELEKGSRFHFTLRSRLGTINEAKELTKEKKAAAAVAAANPFDTPGRPLNILVADDHPANRHLIARILEKRGHSLTFAKNGREAVSRFDEDDIDVVLMDVQMPDMDGYQATAVIRERERESQSHVPIIAVTAHATQGARETCLAAGMDAYLSKPITAVELITLVDSLSDNQINVSVTSATSTGFVAVEESADETLDTEDQSCNAANVVPPVSLNDKKEQLPDRMAFSAALKRLDNDEELLIEQMQFFVDDGPKLLDMIDTALDETDGPRLQIAAHRLKNLCATFDDDESAALCHAFEVHGARDKPDKAAVNQKQLRTAVEKLLNAVVQFCQA